MPRFSRSSERQLSSCHEKLGYLLTEAIKHIDFKVLCGYRGKDEQDKAFDNGFSKAKWPTSKHNKAPSRAVDIVPWHKSKPHIRWEDKISFYYLAGYIQGIGSQLGVKTRWGGDWDQDQDLHDQTFMDLGHFEIVEENSDVQ